MAVVLTILKILGIILLVLLALAILLILLVLLVPIRYRVAGGYNEEDIRADVKVRWLFVKVLGTFRKAEGLKVQAKVAFITVFSMEKPIGKDKDHALPEVEEPVLPPPDESGGQNGTASSGEGTPEEIVGEGVILDQDSTQPQEAEEEIPPEELEIFGDGKPKKETKEEKAERKKREKEAKEQAKQEAAAEGSEEPSESPREKLENIRQKVEVKRRHVEQFLAREHTQRTIQRGKKLLGKIFRHLKPKKGHVDLVMGLSSAADTGMMLGRIARYYPLFGNWLYITPDFYYKRIEVEGEVKGRIRIGSLAMPALFFILKKDTRRTIKLAKKI